MEVDNPLFVEKHRSSSGHDRLPSLSEGGKVIYTLYICNFVLSSRVLGELKYNIYVEVAFSSHLTQF